MKSGYCTLMWNERDHWVSEMNHHQPHQSTVFIKRMWCCVYGGTGRESSIMTSFRKTKQLIPTSTSPSQATLKQHLMKCGGIIQQKMNYLPSGLCKTACFFDDQAKTVTAQLGSSDSTSIFTRHCSFRFLFMLFFTKFS